MNDSKKIAEVINGLSKCENLLSSRIESEPYILAQALLKVSAQPNYNFNADILVVGNPVNLSDSANSYGEASNKLIDAAYSNGAIVGYVVPTASGNIVIFDDQYNENGATYNLVFGKAYKLVTAAEGLVEI